MLSSVEVCTVFWGDLWGQNPAAQTAEQINFFFDSILTSPFFDLLAEYATAEQSIGYGRRIGSVTVTGSDPPQATVTSDDIQNRLLGWIDDGTVPLPNANTLYFVYTPPHVSVRMIGELSCGGFCGYHASMAPFQDFFLGLDFVPYAVIPYLDCQVCTGATGGDILGAMTAASSHELAESITDAKPPSGWANPHATSDLESEIADPAAGHVYDLGGWLVQGVYSDGLANTVPLNVLRPCTWSAVPNWQQVDAFWADQQGAVWADTWDMQQGWANEQVPIAPAASDASPVVAAVARLPWLEDWLTFWLQVATAWTDDGNTWTPARSARCQDPRSRPC